ncbi:hypothetical protein FQN51_006158 [Onygenales sp. PD_10]|nr:hypothetical protein FQN51_006158 [Onygenales sp. PD_10]
MPRSTLAIAHVPQASGKWPGSYRHAIGETKPHYHPWASDFEYPRLSNSFGAKAWTHQCAGRQTAKRTSTLESQHDPIGSHEGWW